MFEVFIDSASNIPAVIVKQYGINVISFINIVDGQEMVCYDPDLDLEGERAAGKVYYDKVRAGATVKTSLINSGQFIDRFEPVLEAGKDILYFSISKNISGTYNAAKLAVEDLMEDYPDRKVVIIDSLNASLATGMLAIYATEMRDKGMDLDKIAYLLENVVTKMNGVFTVGDLKYLANTGRINKAVAKVGNVLHIKPILRGNAEGFIVQFKTCRGRKRSLDDLINMVCDNIIEPAKQFVGIAQADCYEDSLYVENALKEKLNIRGIINTSYDFCTGSHVGPDTVALFFIGYDRELGGKPDGIFNTPELFNYI